MEVKKSFAIRQIADEFLLVPTGKSAIDLNGMITLNEVAADIWKMIPEIESEEQIVERLLELYDAQESEVRTDVSEFMTRLRTLGIVD